MVDYLIVGAGIYGATCARTLTDNAYTCLVIDKRNHIAGNIYTENIDGVEVHKYGAHIFHTDDERVWDFVNLFASFNNYRHTVLAENNNKLYHLPFNLTTMYELFGTRDIIAIKRKIKEEAVEWWKSYSLQHPNTDRYENLETFAITEVGTSIYNTLIKDYTEKQWGKPCDKLSADIIKRLPIRYSFDNNYFNDKYQGIPKEGYTNLIKNMLEGIPVLLNTDFLDNKEYWLSQAKHVIYCGPVDELLDYELGQLEWRSLKFSEVINLEESIGTSVINFTDNKTPFTRVIDHKWFMPETVTSSTVLTYEQPIKWEIGKEIYYSVNNTYTQILYNNYCELLKITYPNIYLGGRLGLYKYMDMDDSVYSALTFCDNICK